MFNVLNLLLDQVKLYLLLGYGLFTFIVLLFYLAQLGRDLIDLIPVVLKG